MIEEKQEFSEKQRHILEIAERLFATNGYEGTSVRDIAHEAGVNIAMISYYFGSKEKLLQSVFEMRVQFIQVQLESMLSNEQLSPLEKVYQFLDNFVERMMNQQQFHKIMVREQIAQKYEPITKLILDAKKRNQELVKKLITDGQKKGVFKKNVDLSLVLITVIGTANQMISTQHIYREINNLEHLSDEDFQKLIRKRLSVHLKTLFKAILTYEQ
ncbi:MAG TPA: TetR family transcriptional regulator [Flavipsychrobacter sp.]|nr:TetR family transcriptional regulator [Flavipsychrobacter sp.]